MVTNRDNKLTIDVTQLLHWQGKLTGIPRVMNELSLRFAKEGVDFVVWDKSLGKFLKVDSKKSLNSRGQKIWYKHDDQFHSKTHVAHRFARKLKSKGVPIPEAAVASLGHAANERNYHKFLPTDMLFILWGEQHEQSYINALVAIHNQGTKLVQLSYDMLPLVAPQYSGHSTYAMASYSKQIFPLCSLILAISLHTKKDIVAWLIAQKLSLPPVEAFRLGDDFAIARPARSSDPLFVEAKLKGGDYILCVGTIEARKNHTLLYYTYKLAVSKNILLPKLIVVGRRGWMTENIYEIIKLDPEVDQQIVILENQNDEELSWLYEHALFSVYPSFYEGWGLPIAESLSRGVPCACSNTSSMPEVAGNIATYFSPYSPDECLNAIVALLQPGKLKKQRSAVKKYKQVSWDDTFKEVSRLIKGIS